MILKRTPLYEPLFCDIDMIKRELGSVSSEDEAILHDLILQASSALQDHLDRVLVAQDLVEAVIVSSVRSFRLSSRPVFGAVEVLFNDDLLKDIIVEAESGVVSQSDFSPLPSGRYCISYSAGYVPPGKDGRTLPPAIERATAEIVKYWYHARSRDSVVRSEKVDVLETVYFQNASLGGFPPGIETLLEPYQSYR